MKGYLRKIWKTLLAGAVCLLLAAGVFFLYDLPMEAMAYVAVLWSLAGLAALGYGYYRYSVRRKTLSYILETLPLNLDALPEPSDENEAVYQEMLARLDEERRKAQTQRQRFYSETTDYYTMWVHQIKTPISALRLLLSEHEAENRESLGELLRVEQYVEMVLGYLRTEDMSSDMNFSMCSLDEIVREQVHKYARIFVGKKLSLTYQGVEERVLTDKKWLGFVIGQLLSNALKYTKTGGISIYMSPRQPHTLVIADTGIGIAPQDLPRVFEKGFTGNNGRSENRSTGLGLYLVKKIMKRLNHGIYLESEPGKGTKVYLNLARKKRELY